MTVKALARRLEAPLPVVLKAASDLGLRRHEDVRLLPQEVEEITRRVLATRHRSVTGGGPEYVPIEVPTRKDAATAEQALAAANEAKALVGSESGKMLGAVQEFLQQSREAGAAAIRREVAESISSTTAKSAEALRVALSAEAVVQANADTSSAAKMIAERAERKSEEAATRSDLGLTRVSSAVVALETKLEKCSERVDLIARSNPRSKIDEMEQALSELRQRVSDMEKLLRAEHEPPEAVRLLESRVRHSNSRPSIPLPPVAWERGTRLLEERGLYFPEQLVRQCVSALAGNRALLLEGPPGTGKTSLAQALTAFFFDGEPASQVSRVQANPNWTSEDLLGFQDLFPPNNWPGYRAGILTDACLRCSEADGRHWLVIEDLTRCDPDRLIAPLFDILLSPSGGVLPISPDLLVPMPEAFRLICTRNDDDQLHLFDMSIAARERFVRVRIPPPSLEDERGAIHRRYPEAAKRFPELERCLELLQEIRSQGERHGLQGWQLGMRFTLKSIIEPALNTGRGLDATLAEAMGERLTRVPGHALAGLLSRERRLAEFPETLTLLQRPQSHGQWNP